jgi:hypothetical protein
MRHGWYDENEKLRTNLGIFKIIEGVLFFGVKTEHFTMLLLCHDEASTTKIYNLNCHHDCVHFYFSNIF